MSGNHCIMLHTVRAIKDLKSNNSSPLAWVNGNFK